MHYPLDSVAAVDYSQFAHMDKEFNGPPGYEHYKLLSHLSMQFNNSIIIDIGTHRGSSALALSYNPTNTVHTFDILDKVTNEFVRKRENIKFSLDNLFDDPSKWEATILSAAFIFLDVDPHNGTMEMDMYNYLKRIGYKGFVVCDDIWYFKEMRDNFWSKIPYEERYDVTHLGHWSGTGIFTFNPEITFPKADTTGWTLVTAYFDLTKCPDASVEIQKRDAAHYLSNAKSTMTVPYNLIVYCEESNLETLKAMRPAELQAKTRYVVRKFDEIYFKDDPSKSFAEYRNIIAENRRRKPYNFDNRNTASYYLFCMSRYIMLREVIDENPFNSTHFAWINICIERMGMKNVELLDKALSVKRDKFSTCYIDYIPESLVKNTAEYYKWGRCGMCSGFFTGNAEYMRKVCGKIEDKFLEYAEAGYGHADEQLYSPVYFENKELFQHYYGDYKQMITNYVDIHEAAEAPVYNFIRNSYKHGDFAKCREACEFVWSSIQKKTCTCQKQYVDELERYRVQLNTTPNNTPYTVVYSC
jgi:hypothetical protein